MRTELIMSGMANIPSSRAGLARTLGVEPAVTLAVALWFAVALAGLVLEGHVPPPDSRVLPGEPGGLPAQSSLQACASPGRIAIAL